MLPLIVLAAATASPASSDTDNPLNKSDAGFVQCYEPNDSAKTCASLAAYKRNGDGTWDNTAVVSLSPNKPITLETITTVRIKDGAVCGYIRNEDVLRGKLRVAGQLVPDDKAKPILIKIAVGMAPLMNREICTKYVTGQRDLLAKAHIEGGIPSVPDQHVRWMLPTDGYSVATAPVGNTARPSG